MKPSSSSSSSSSSSADSSSRGAVPITLSAAPHSSQLMVSPSSTSSSSTSILPSHAGHVTILIPPEYLLLYDRQPRLQVLKLAVRGLIYRPVSQSGAAS